MLYRVARAGSELFQSWALLLYEMYHIKVMSISTFYRPYSRYYSVT